MGGPDPAKPVGGKGREPFPGTQAQGLPAAARADMGRPMSPAQPLRAADALTFAERVWEDEILPTITEYIRIPNKSQAFDARWRENGHMDRAVALIEGWCKKQPIPGLTVEVVRLGDRSPVIFMEVPGEGSG